MFEQIAALLDQQGASPLRVRAWRSGAHAVRANEREVADVFRDHGREGLEAIPSIGPRLANVIIEIVKTGHCSALDRLRGDAIHVLENVPGIGRCLAERTHRLLGVETLEQLEAAAHDGRLAQVPGFGERRIAIVRDVLATRLRKPPEPTSAQPDVALLLEIDRAYRDAVMTGKLHKIAPRRFNPTGQAWLPIFHDDREGWSFTAMYSNTALAHQLGRTNDWVVIYFHRGNEPDGQATIVTEWRGALRDHRVVRGREAECETYYFPTDHVRHAS